MIYSSIDYSTNDLSFARMSFQRFQAAVTQTITKEERGVEGSIMQGLSEAL